MRPVRGRLGFTLAELMVTLFITGVLSAMALPLSRSMIGQNQLSTASEVLSRDLERARLRALDGNRKITVRRQSDQTYNVDGKDHQLAGEIRFSAVSADSITFSRLGVLADGIQQSFMLVHPEGDSHTVLVRPAGLVEVETQ